MKYYLLGINSFIAKSYYLLLRKQGISDIVCLSHDTNSVVYKDICADDVLINFCGINRANLKDDYENGNHLFLREIFNNLNKESLPYFMHLSSYMVNGFEGLSNDKLPNYQRWFVESKLEGENFLQSVYPVDKLTIIRPSNIYGYQCLPYYNNLLVTLMYEKIQGNHTIKNINSNCERNFLSIEGLINAMNDLIKKSGIYNIVSNVNVTLDKLLYLMYDKEGVPNAIQIATGEKSILAKTVINGSILEVEENILEKLENLERQILSILLVKKNLKIEKRDMLVQPRGNMVEISDLHSKRLYMITLTNHSVRGNHYHFLQVEDFYIHKGQVLFLLSHKDDKDTIYIEVMKAQERITVYPSIIHTLIKDFPESYPDPEIFITSTQEYISGSIPDTVYVNL